MNEEAMDIKGIMTWVVKIGRIMTIILALVMLIEWVNTGNHEFGILFLGDLVMIFVIHQIGKYI